ncbi:RNA polymerase sigma-70 factor (ECF subfamily) [Mucilaginibacter frigoritolerans]|uniref:RNA polymerase sigma-70 factor (ECF subfamily) n=1 Tax=Mucilaginibacter frigoritolerans TaxID=652788 RepID=A0A562UFL3_9SPHI|nr:RNA polymerase sigma factor [Mucilaginibacter frigoritolerans]TWJ04379.1 RNA polymerase sigma-70 factor (ECF subfamily) [Mucilaginibacter frigoritolerans]
MEFEEIYLKYSPQIFRVCMGYINDYEAAKDLTQETFISVWKNLDSFKNQSKISTWIFRIATNNCLRAIEKSKRVTTEELPLNLADKLEENNDEKLAFLYNCIAELEETERIIISLVLEDLSRDEIASIVGLSSVNTRVKIHRIKDKLAQKFKQHGQFE